MIQDQEPYLGYSMNTKQQHIEKIWDGMAEFGASRMDEALDFILGQLAELVNAQQAAWFASVRMSDTCPNDPAMGWRLANLYMPSGSAVGEEQYQDHSKRLEKGTVDESVVARLRDAGTFRTSVISRIMPAEWFESEFFQTMYGITGKQDGLFVAMPLGEDVESWFGFYRQNSATPHFDQEDEENLALATRAMKSFHRQVALSYGLLIAQQGITPAERRVLNELLAGKSTKQIAALLDLTEETIKTYTARICRKFNVNGRSRLLGLWLGE